MHKETKKRTIRFTSYMATEIVRKLCCCVVHLVVVCVPFVPPLKNVGQFFVAALLRGAVIGIKVLEIDFEIC